LSPAKMGKNIPIFLGILAFKEEREGYFSTRMRIKLNAFLIGKEPGKYCKRELIPG